MWQKGQSGNPRGRPPVAYGLTNMLRAELDKRSPDGRTNKEVIAEIAVKLALQGEMRALEFIAERVDGKVTVPIAQTVEMAEYDGYERIAAKLARLAEAQGQDEERARRSANGLYPPDSSRNGNGHLPRVHRQYP